MICFRWAPGLLFSVLAFGCAGADSPAVETPEPPATTIVTLTPSATVPPASTPTATTTAEPVLLDIRVTHLSIPAVGIDSEVQGSQAIPDTAPATPGCPAKPAGQQTLTVPQQGIATPEEAFKGLENKAWIYGHSRWRGDPGLFYVLQDVRVGDELFVEGVDRETGDPIARGRYVVEGIYLTDTTSGGALVTADSPAEIPVRPTVILQTSVRERGEDRPWILDRETVLARATNLVDGDMNDPCKYLLLFVVARSS